MTWVQQLEQLGGQLHPENIAHHHCPEEKAHLFQTFEGGGTEIETLWLLWAIVRMIKPNFVLETGTFHGIGTAALASALWDNNKGKLLTIELDAAKASLAKKLAGQLGVADFVEFVNQDSIAYLKTVDTRNVKFDFAFFDSSTVVRPLEFKVLYEKGALTNLVAFHDTSRLREKSFKVESEPQDVYVAELDRIERTYCKGALEFYLAKGLRLMQLDRNINPAFY